MYVNGLTIPQGIRYFKSVLDEGNPEYLIDPDLKTLVAKGKSSLDLPELDPVADIPFDTISEFIKLPTKLASLTIPGVKFTKKCYESFEIDLIVVKVTKDIEQYDDFHDSVRNTYRYSYDRLVILLRDDQSTLADLKLLLSDLDEVDVEYLGKDEDKLGTLTNMVIRSKDQVIDKFYTMDPIDYNGDISVLDWSHAMDGLLKLIQDQLKNYSFSDPVTTLEQELPEKANLIKYDFSDIQPSGRGHLVGMHWKHFLLSKLPFSIELLLTDTESYVRLLHEIQGNLKLTNIGDYWVTANDGMRWKVAVEWNYPIDNSFDLNEPKGSSATTGNSIKLSGFLHFNTVAKNELKDRIENILYYMNGELVESK